MKNKTNIKKQMEKIEIKKYLKCETITETKKM